MVYLVFVGVIYFDGSYVAWEPILSDALLMTGNVFVILGPIMVVWFFVSFWLHRRMIFAFSGAKPLTRQENPEIYNIVENLCISRGLPNPKVGIIEDDSMNAFAVGWRPKDSWIVFSRGLLEKLNKAEIEAVAAHELTHIMNRDSYLMVVIVVVIGIVAILGEILLRVGLYSRGNSNDKGSGQFKMVMILLGIVFMIVGYLIFPLLRLALSRKREFLADAGAVELTKDREAMISALQKISGDPVIESIEKETIAAMCIQTPFAKDKKKGILGRFHGLLRTHPPIEERIAALKI